MDSMGRVSKGMIAGGFFFYKKKRKDDNFYSITRSRCLWIFWNFGDNPYVAGMLACLLVCFCLFRRLYSASISTVGAFACLPTVLYRMIHYCILV